MNARRHVVHGTLAAALLATAGLATTGLAWAQAPAHTAPGYGSRAQLTDEQARQLDELREEYEEEMLALEIRLDAAEGRLDAARRGPEVDIDQVIALRRETRDLEGQLEDVRLRADAEAARLLGHQPGATLDGPGQSRGHGRWRGWRGACSWGACPWDGAWRGGDRATPWWGSSSWMGRRGSRAGWSRHCW